MADPYSDSVEIAAAPIIYVTDLTYNRFDPADLFDLAFLLQSPRHQLQSVALASESDDGVRIIENLASIARAKIAHSHGLSGLVDFLHRAESQVNLLIVGGYSLIQTLIEEHRALVREKVARIFVVGGFINDYSPERAMERIPISPRLKEQHSDRFAPEGDRRIDKAHRSDFGRLLSSGEGIIWLPRDICLWRYAAPQLLTDGGPLCEFLLRESFWHRLNHSDSDSDRYMAAEAPVLISSLPALLLATEPDPFAWMRLFRVVPAFVQTGENGAPISMETQTETPNLYVVIAIDGQALGKLLTKTLRVRPLMG